MSKKPETKFRESTYPQLNRLPNTWWSSIQQKAIRGTPDILLCINGKFVALEYKATPKSSVDDLQVYNLDKIEQAGGVGLIVHPGNWGKIYQVLLGLASLPAETPLSI